jgi:T-complex protein 1 subunit zeta
MRHLSALQGFEVARKAALEFLDTFKQPLPGAAAGASGADAAPLDRETLRCVARTRWVRGR